MKPLRYIPFLLLTISLLFISSLGFGQTIHNITTTVGERPLLISGSNNDCWNPNTYLSLGPNAKQRYFETTWSEVGYFVVQKICGSDNLEFRITVNAGPAVVFNPPSPVCRTYGIIDLTLYVSPTGGTFTSASPGLVGSNFNPFTAGLGDHVITYTSGSSVNATIRVEPEFTAVIIAGGPTTFCQGGSVTLTADPVDGDSYLWYRNGALISGDFPVNYTATLSGDYKVEIQRDKCIEESNTITVTVNPLPENRVITATNYCAGPAGGSITVPNSENGINYQIRTVPGDVAYGSALIGNGANLTWNNVPAGTYKVVATTAAPASCPRELNTVTITAYPLPTPSPTSSNPGNRVCLGNSITLFSGDATGSSWDWTPAATLNNASFQNPIATPTVSTTYSVTVTDVYGCQASGSITILVDAVPPININGTFTICNGASTTLTGTSTHTIVDWLWSSGDVTPSTTVSPSITTPYTLTVTDNRGCVNSRTQTVTVNDRPTANAGPDRVMCFGAGVTITATAINGTPPYNFLWSDGTNNATTTVNPLGNSVFSVTVTDANLCSHTDDMQVTVVTNPTVNAGLDQAICHGATATLTAAHAGGGTAPYGYTWLPGGASGASIDVSPTNPVYNAAPILYTYNVTITDFYGCTGTDNVNVSVNSLTSLTIANDGAVYCQDAGPVPLVATPPGGVWSNVSGTFVVGNTIVTSDPPVTPGTYTFRYTYTNSNGCVSTLDASATILPYSTPNITDIQIANEPDYCHTDVGPHLIQGIMVPDLTGLTGINQTLTGPGVTDTGNGSGFLNPAAAGQGNHNITFSVTNPGGCNASRTETIQVGLPVTITAPANMCFGDAPQILGVDVPGGQWTITFVDDATSTTTVIGPIPEGDPAAMVEATVPGTYTIEYWIEDIAISCDNTTTATCVVHPLPNLSFNIGSFASSHLDINFCTNDSPQVLVGLNGGVPSGGGLFSGAGVIGMFFYPSTGAGNYNITYQFTDANGCFNSVVSNNIEVNLAPAVDVTGFNALATYCNSDAPFTITGVPTSGTLGFGIFSFPGSWVAGNQYVDNGDGTAVIRPQNINPTGTFSITYSVADVNGCTGTVSKTFTINQIPTVDFVGIPVSGKICNNASPITLTGSPAGVTGVFSPLAGLTDNGNGTAIFDPTAILSNVYTITYTYTHPTTSCVNFISKQIEVVALPLEKLLLTPDGLSYCQAGLGVRMGVSNSQTGVVYRLYRNNPANLVGTVTGDGNDINFPGFYLDGVYTFTATSPDGCLVTMADTKTITEIPLPLIYDVTASSTNYCQGATGVTINLSNSQAGFIYTLYKDGVAAGIINSPGGAISWSDNIAGVYTVRAQTSGIPSCEQAMNGVITVTERPLPVVSAGPDREICPGGSAILNASGGVIYLWAPAAGLSNVNVANPVASPVVTTTYTVTVTDAFGCSATDQTVVTVFPSIPISISPATPAICNGQSITLTATAGASYLWNTGATTQAINPSPSSDATYSVTVTDANGCSSSTSTTVTVNPLPLVNAGPDVAICEGQTVTLTVTGSADTYLWSTGAITTSINVTTAATYTVTGTITATGCDFTDDVVVTVDPLPNPFTLSSLTDAYCQGTGGITVTLDGSDIGVNYQLLKGGSNDGPIRGGDGNPIVWTNRTAGVYTVRATIGSCNRIMGGTVVLTEVVTPTIHTVTASALRYCNGGSGVTINLSGSQTGVEYTLYKDGVADGTLPGTGAALAWTNRLAGTYTVIASAVAAPLTCQQTMNGSPVITEDVPLSPDAGPNVTICEGQSTTLTATGGTNYSWNTTPVQNTASISVSPVTTTTYTVTVSDINGCSATDNVTVTVNPSPVAWVDPAYEICSGNSVTLTATGGVDYAWSPVNGLSATDISNPTASPINTTVYTVTVTDANGCSASALTTVTVNPLPTSYNVIGGGAYCFGGGGAVISLSNSEVGIDYRLLHNGSPIPLLPDVNGTGAAFSFPAQTAAGTYTVLAINTVTGCERLMNGSRTITISDTSDGGVVSGGSTICYGDNSDLLELTGQQGTILRWEYSFNAVTWSNITNNLNTYTGIALTQTTRYRAVVKSGECPEAPSAHTTVTVNPASEGGVVTGGGPICAGSNSPELTLSGHVGNVVRWERSTDGIAWSTIANIATTYTSGPLNDVGPNYFRAIVKSGACNEIASASTIVTVNALPIVYDMNGGGFYCAGGTGVPVGLTGSENFVNYQLQLGGVDFGAPVAGSGAGAGLFGNQTTAGVYSAWAQHSVTGCQSVMNGTTTVGINPLPTVSAGPDVAICYGSSTILTAGGAHNYQWSGGPATQSYTVSPTVTTTYTVVGTDLLTCSNSASVTVTVNPNPGVYNVTGGGTYGDGDPGVEVGLSGSELGVNYQLMHYGFPIGVAVPGTGLPLNFGYQTLVGTFTVEATSAILPTSCTAPMAGSAVVFSDLPTIGGSVDGGSTICFGEDSGVLTLTGHNVGSVVIMWQSSTDLVNWANIVNTNTTYTAPNLTQTTHFRAVVQEGVSPQQFSSHTTVIVIPASIGGVVTGGTTICSGGTSAQLTLAWHTGDVVRWESSIDNGTNWISLGNPNSTTYTSGALIDTTWFRAVVQTNAVCSEANSVHTVVNVLNLPAPQTVTVENSGFYCIGGVGVDVGLNNSETDINYFLYRNGVLTGATMGGLTGNPINFGKQTATGNYTVVARNAAGCERTMTGTVTVSTNPLPISYTLTGSGSYCAGGTGLTITLEQSQNGVNYQLYRNITTVGAPIPGDGNPLVWNDNTVGNYTVIATTDDFYLCTNTMNGTVVITETAQVVITTAPIGVTACETYSATFTVGATGQNLTYQWQRNGFNLADGVLDGATISGSTSNALVINDLTLDFHNDSIRCIVYSTCVDSVITTPVKLFVNPITTISVPPTSSVECTGSSHTFTVVATGVNNTYVWEKGGVILNDPLKYENFNTQSLTIHNIVAADAGTYICRVVGTCGNEVQTSATLTVDSPITISLHPTPQTACVGSTVSFTTAANAAGTILSYQWQKYNTGTSTYEPILGATSSSYSIPSVVDTDAGTFRCVISSPCGNSQATNPAVLSITPATVINNQPIGDEICAGSNYVFTVAADGHNLQYEWFKGGTLLTDGGVYSNTSTANLALTGVTTAESGSYAVRVTGTCGIATSTAANLQVYNPITFVSHPTSQTICSGGDATFSVVVTGDVDSLQWQKWNITSSLFEPAFGISTNSDYTIYNSTPDSAGIFRCLIYTTSCGTYYSAEVTLTVNDSPNITNNPSNQSVCEGASVSFSVNATGVGLTYQWYKNGVNPIAGATNATLNLYNVTLADAGNYYCTVTGLCGFQNSTVGVLSVDAAPVISAHPIGGTICEGKVAELTVLVSAGTNLSYQWYHNGNPEGPNSNIYLIPNFAALDIGGYHVVISSPNCPSVTSNTATLSMVSDFDITTHPVPNPKIVCLGSTAIFTVDTDEPNDDVSYQWQKNGVPIAGATSADLIINNVSTSDNGVYSCVASNLCNSWTSNGAQLIVVSNIITISQHPQNKVVCTGQTFSLNVVASTTTGEALTYEWYKVDNPPVYKGSGTSYTKVFDPTDNDDGQYYCIVSNGCTTVQSEIAEVSEGAEAVTDAPVTVSPQAELCVGLDVTLTVADSTGFTYQWQRNGINLENGPRISGVNSNVLSITNVQKTDDAIYSCVITGTCGIPKTSESVDLDIYAPPIILPNTGPAPVTVCVGGSAVFSLMAQGDNLDYQWEYNDGSGVFTPLIGEELSFLTIDTVAQSNAGFYRCEVSNSACSSVTSTSAELTVLTALDISSATHPTSQTVCDNANVSFTFSITAPVGATYQWYKGATPLQNGPRITGVTLPTLNINNVSSADNDIYWCQVLSTCGNTESNPATLTVHSPISIISHPQSDVVCVGNTLNLHVQATGIVNSYQWYFKEVGGAAFAPIAWGTGQTYSIISFPADSAGSYYCELTNFCGTRQTDTAVISDGATTTAILDSQFQNLTPCVGTNVNITVTSTGTNRTYSWYRGTTLLSDGGRISGTTTPSLNINNVQASDNGVYTCYVSGTCGVANVSTPLTVQLQPAITSQPYSMNVCEGNPASFFVVANGTNLKYRWFKLNSSDVWDSIPIADVPSAITSTLSIATADADAAGLYRCAVYNSCDSIFTTPATLTVNSVPTIASPPTVDGCVGGIISIPLTLTGGTPLSYQWLRNGVPLSNGGGYSGVTSHTLTISNLATSHEGFFTCEVYSGCNTITSPQTQLRVSTPITITQHPLSQTLCPPGNVTLVVIASGSHLEYQWQRSDIGISNYIDIPTATNFFRTVTNEGDYRVVISNGCETEVSNTATVNLGVPTTAVIAPESENQTRCVGSGIIIAVGGTGTDRTYQWFKDEAPLSDGGRIAGSTTDSLKINSIQPSDAGVYTCYVSGGCGNASVSTQLTVHLPPAISVNPVNVSVCEGNQVSFFVVANGSNLKYRWFRLNSSNQWDSVLIADVPSAITSTLSIATADADSAGMYRCAVYNSCDSIISTPATLTVYENTSIAALPSEVNGCQGGTVSIPITTTGGAPLTYQWLRNGVPLTNGGSYSGVNTHTLIISNLSVANEGLFSCEVYNGCITQASTQTQLRVSTPITITQHPMSQMVCPGGSVNLSVVATGNYLSYQWYNGVNPVGNSMTYTTNISGNYHVVVSNGCETETSNVAVISPAEATNYSISANITQCEGTDATFTVTHTSGTNVSFQWYRGSTALTDGPTIAGSNTNTLIIKNITSSDAATYQCIVSGFCGNQSDLLATLTVRENVRIVVQPVSTSVLLGNNVSLSVIATGLINSYLWMKDGQPITEVNVTGINSATLQITAATLDNAGVYSCYIDGECSDVVSNSAVLTVLESTIITQHPEPSVTKCEGETLTLSVLPSSGYTFQWKRGNTTLVNDGRISGATSSILTISNLTVDDQGAYTCIVGSEISQPAIVVVNPSVNITQNPIDANKCEGDSHIFSVSATGEVTTYEWFKVGTPNTLVHTGREYIISSLSTTHTGNYFARVEGTCGGLVIERISSIAQLTVSSGITINQQLPLELAICQNVTDSLKFDVNGDNLTFQWFKDGQAITQANVTGANTNRIIINNAQEANAGVYSCLVSGPCGSAVNSNSTTVVVHPTTAITLQPISRTRCEGDNVTFTVVAQGGDLTYQWYKNGTIMSGEANSSISFVNLNKELHEGSYRCEIEGICGDILNSNPATLTINRATIIQTPTETQFDVVCVGDSRILSVTATGDNLTYLWKRNGAVITESHIDGQNTSSLNINGIQLTDAGVYSCNVTGTCGSTLTSHYFNISVNPATAITTHPLSYTRCEGDMVTFTVVAQGGDLGYQWYRNNVLISGANSSTLTYTSLNKIDHEGTYYCVVTGNCGSAIQSNPAVLTINVVPQITVPNQPITETICQGTTKSLSVTAIGDNLTTCGRGTEQLLPMLISVVRTPAQST